MRERSISSLEIQGTKKEPPLNILTEIKSLLRLDESLKAKEFQTLIVLYQQMLEGKLKIENLENPRQKTKIVSRTFYQNPQEAISGKNGGEFSYYEWTQIYYARNERIPNNPDNPINELVIGFWWLGNKSGNGNSDIADYLKIIANYHLLKLPTLIETAKNLEPEKKQAIIEKCRRIGTTFLNFSQESMFIDYQLVSRQNHSSQLKFDRRWTIWISSLLNGWSRVNLIYNNQQDDQYNIFFPPENTLSNPSDLILSTAETIERLKERKKINH